MDLYSMLGFLGILLITIGLFAFWGLVYRDIKKISNIQLNHIRTVHPTHDYRNEYLNERLGNTDAIGTL